MLTEQTRYRLTGLVFLVAVAAVVLPMLFDGDGVETMHLDPLPAADFEVEPETNPPADLAPALEARDQLRQAIDEDGYTTATSTRLGEPVLLQDSADVASDLKWAVQLGSFSQGENATALRDRLRADGYAAFLSNVKEQGERATRVAVGPLIDHGDAVALKTELDQRYELEAVIMRFTF